MAAVSGKLLPRKIVDTPKAYCYCPWRVILVEGLLEVRTVTFSRASSQNCCLNGWWVRIWIGAGGEPSCAEECFFFFWICFRTSFS